ncbi:MAG: hypothetical protein IJ936_01880 [Peptococcaceae bacterium]|nr:hypothetical protein [Peptococcaceae bacterium]
METITSVMNNPSMLDMINNFLATKGIYSLVLILMFLGMFGMIISNNASVRVLGLRHRFLPLADGSGGKANPILPGKRLRLCRCGRYRFSQPHRK